MLGAWSIVCATDGMLGARFTAALAECLASHGKRVLLLELSPSLPALDILLGVGEKVVYTISDIARIDPLDVMLPVRENLFLVPQGLDDTDVDAASLSACICALKPDVVLISAERAKLPLVSEFSDGVLLLTDASPIGLRAASAWAQCADFDGFVLTDFLPTRAWITQSPSLTSISDALGLPLFGILPHIDTNNTYTSAGKNFLLAVRNMAKRIMGENIPLLCGIPVEGMRRRTFLERIAK